MLNQLQKLRTKKSEQGFTIIEVMIVLAIAGLIILIVMLAVPALQRNGRNTAIKNDASAVTAGIAEFSSNNDGALPTAADSDSTTTPGEIIIKNKTGAPATVKVQSSTKVNLVKDGSVKAITPVSGELNITFGTKCPTGVAGNATAITPTLANRSSTLIYGIEGSGGTVTAKCIDS